MSVYQQNISPIYHCRHCLLFARVSSERCYIIHHCSLHLSPSYPQMCINNKLYDLVCKIQEGEMISYLIGISHEEQVIICSWYQLKKINYVHSYITLYCNQRIESSYRSLINTIWHKKLKKKLSLFFITIHPTDQK